MEHKKTVSAILSAVTACTLLPAFPAVYAAETEVPDWVPADFKEACSFDNTYGSTLVKDDIICIVTRHTGEGTVKRLPLLGSGNCKTLADEWYKGEFEIYGDLYPYYHVTVYQPEESKSIVFYNYDTESGKETAKEDQYVFSVDPELHVTETDWRSVVPDCIKEYRDFIAETGKEYGLGNDGFTSCNIDGRGCYVLMAAGSSGFVGSFMDSTVMVNGKKQQLKTSGCNTKYEGPEPTDQGSNFVRYLQITEPAEIEATFTRRTDRSELEAFSVTRKLKAEKDSKGFITVSAADEPADEEEWRKYVPDTSAEAYTFLRSEGLISSSEPYNEFNIDNRGDYLIAAAANYGGLSSAMAMIELEKDGKPLRLKSVNCKPAAEPGMVIDGECLISYAKITEPCTIKAFIRNGQENYQKETTITVTEDADGKLCFAAEDEFAFLPKSFEEAEAFYKANGVISEHKGYIVCCGETNRTTGYSILTDTAGSAGAEVVKQVQFSLAQDTLKDGADRTYQFTVLKPLEKGKLKVTVRQAREWNPDDGRILQTKFYYVRDYLSLAELKITMGDLDGDGQMTTADLVLLSKYLGGTQNLDEVQFFAADLRNDNRINAADLSVMKRQLAEIRNPSPSITNT